jgi:methyl-accepting chemotaxis protein
MNPTFTFGQKIAMGFAAIFAFVLILSIFTVSTLQKVTVAKDEVLEANAKAVIATERLRAQVLEKVVDARGYALTRDEALVEAMTQSRMRVLETLGHLKAIVQGDPEASRRVGQVEALELAHQKAWEKVLAEIKAGATSREVVQLVIASIRPRQIALEAGLTDLIQYEDEVLAQRKASSSQQTREATNWIMIFTAISALCAGVLAWYLTRLLTGQIASAVQHVQSSASELQASANEQAAGSKEQASAVNEIATTIKELLSTSRQIAESSQRVSVIADETVKSAQEGDHTVQQGQEAISMIKRQTDHVVTQVLELGKRSQQIGGVVDIITELAEQTNILAINATIEAAGAGEAGKRFSVVADEIRKLADRVGSSAKDIQGIIEEIRGSVNTTVMATESGSKAVEAGTQQFGEVTRAFQEIVDSVTIATQAAREIELSTKQQSTAVEQVNTAISDVAQAVQEMESNSTQTLQTSSQLARLSQELSSLVQKEKRVA